ncbi:WD40 repeat-like protein, partial [Suhomyces tanzawaensis NRRL Y-17324]
MGDFYEPTLLFRNNAIRRYSPQLSPIASVESLPYTNNCSSWLLNPNNSKDNQVLNQSCSLDRLNIKSNYWKIPDNNLNLTSMSINNQESNPTLAISSANSEANLFIYELDLIDNYLTHHNTISLPNIHSMKWLPSNPRYLVTGNSKGYAHLISVPSVRDNLEDEDASAEICKRFNHKKHLRNKTEDEKNASISKLNFLNSDLLLSLYSNHLFHWDIRSTESQSKPSPLSISTIAGIYNFDPVSKSSNNVGICGRFGVSLFDLRQPRFNMPKSVANEANRKKLGANLIKWNPNDENVFASSHGDGVVRLWDIRKQESFTSLNGHQDKVTSIEWNNGDIFTGSRDGNIIHWDLTNDMPNNTQSSPLECGLKEGLDSVHFNPRANSLEDTINQRQCGTVLPASNTNIISMCSVQCSSDPEDLKVLSIDGSSFFGVHSKIYNAVSVNINSEKLYYSEEDIQLLLASKENSNATLVDPEAESLHETKPLIIRR